MSRNVNYSKMITISDSKLQQRKKRIRTAIFQHWQLYLLLVLPLTWVLIFKYYPMYGLQIAFKDYVMKLGFWGSEWVGLKYFKTFIGSHYFPRLIGNTMLISCYSIVAGFFPPIILAIIINECKSRWFKKSVQLITYAPHFLSTVVIVSILTQVLSLHGFVNSMISAIGLEPVSFLSESRYFKSIYVWSGIWQNVGYSSIIYISALSGINPELYEAAIIDGANIWKRIYYVDLPGILPTAIILLILSTARILDVGFEKVYLMQNPLNMRASDVISTYTYRVGLVDMNYSMSTAIGLFQSSISLVLITVVNKISSKLSDTSLW